MNPAQTIPLDFLLSLAGDMHADVASPGAAQQCLMSEQAFFYWALSLEMDIANKRIVKL